jgi:hypothetical protein
MPNMIYRTNGVDLYVDVTLRDRLSRGFWISALTKNKAGCTDPVRQTIDAEYLIGLLG